MQFFRFFNQTKKCAKFYKQSVANSWQYGHREHTILLSRKRVNKEMKSMNRTNKYHSFHSFTYSSHSASVQTCASAVFLVSSNTKWRPPLLVRLDLYLSVWLRCRADEFSFYFGHCTGKNNSSWRTCSRLRKGREIQ